MDMKHDESKLPLVSLEDHSCYCVKPNACSHGGLITYVDNSFEVTGIKKIDNLAVWEGLFVELKHNSLKNNFLIENMYKPPTDNDNANDMNAFTIEIEPVLQERSSTYAEVLICGDYNINLLKLTGESHPSDFFDIMLGHSFIQKLRHQWCHFNWRHFFVNSYNSHYLWAPFLLTWLNFNPSMDK